MNMLQRIFITLTLLGAVLFVLHPLALAVTPTTKSVTTTPIPSPKPTPIEYVLPYPGILPTHPLYFLKNLRDQIIELLITSPLSKAEFYLLQADKKLNMGITLSGLGNTTQVSAVLTDALHSRSQAIELLEHEVKAGSTVPGHLIEKLTSSLSKHKEVLTQLGESIEGIEALITRVQHMAQPSSQ